MKASIVESDSYSLLPADTRIWLAEQVQSERPYSPCDVQTIDRDMLECTHSGCISVLLYSDDDELIAGGEIILITRDFHVGDCFAYLWSWVRPDHRHGEAARYLVRAIRECTKATAGVNWYMLTREVSPRVFKVTYSQVKK